MDRDAQELELLEAMSKGVNDYLKTTRGAHAFGTNASASVVDNEVLIVTTAVGEWIFFSSTGL